jgi:PAS domain S-box-containing protein
MVEPSHVEESVVSLPPLPQSVRDARAFVRSTLTGTPVDHLIDDAQLAVSEVVTNAVVHAGTPIEVAVSVGGGGVRVAVSDGSPRMPRRREYADTAGTGRGLRLLTELATDWGADARGDGKTVWFALGAEAASPDQGSGPHRDEHPDAASATGAPVAGSGQPSGATAVQLLNVPVLLYGAWRQHAETLLREYFLYQLDRGADEEAVGVHSAASDALALLDESVPPAPATDTPAQALAAAIAPEAYAAGVLMSVPASVRPHFGTLDEALDEATGLAEDEQLLAPPVQPELRQVRRWLCDQVETQSGGGAPRPWEPFDPTAPDAPAAPSPEAAHRLAWDTSQVSASDLAVIAADDRSAIVAASPSAVRVLGYDAADDLVGLRLITVIPDRYRQAHLAGFTFHLLTGHGALLDVPVTVPFLCRDATEILVELTLSQQHAADGRPVFLAHLMSPAHPS